MTKTAVNPIPFRTLMFVLFLLPCAFAAAQVGAEATVARTISLVLTLVLGCVYAAEDLLRALFDDDFKAAFNRAGFVMALAVAAIAVAGLVVIWAF